MSKVWDMNKKQFTKLGVFRDILETDSTKGKVEQFLNQPEVSEESLRKRELDLGNNSDEEDSEEYEQIAIQLHFYNNLREAKELYLKLYNHILEDLETLAELEQKIIQSRAIVNYDDDSSKFVIYLVNKHRYLYAKTHFYDVYNDSTDLRTIICKMEDYGLETLENAYSNKEVRNLTKTKVLNWMMEHSNATSDPIWEIKDKVNKKIKEE